ncbi:hypothetical protein HC026_11140 [Lactobacillus sp. LC28-10]|uniref:Uncharacterized protein n=1 Tax=Secundilactobacillus angelensis TaxID=2722706 RepID=A0ABX1L1V5_9LACO|nr:hypothetical protein [Secundilactobacillus angelensis]MCH5463194.1 hypothetical protein [Secundilactobacillus angelensis]NLR19447.1 hypothetical protein [Secundilactobacillus angelensis]
MLKQSDAFNKMFASDSRTLSIKATVAGKDYTADDLTSVEYDSAAMTGETMGIGSTYENSVKITFANLVEGIKAKDEVTVSIGAKLSDGTVEYAPMGVFYVDDDISMDRNNNVTEITADDAMCMLEGVYTPKVTVPTNLSAMALDIANQAGVPINQDNFSKLPVIGLSRLPKNQTYRTVLGWLAMMIPGYATFDRSGQLCLRGITGSEYAVTPDEYEFQGLTKNENPYTVAGITITQDTSTDDYSATDSGNSVNTSDTSASATATDDSDSDNSPDTDVDTGDTDDSSTDDTNTNTTDDGDGVTFQAGATTGSVIAVQNNLMTQDILDDMWKVIQPIQYYPYTLNWFGNPAVEAGDWLEISDTQGNKFTVPNNSYVLTFDGGLSAVSSTGETVTSGNIWDYHGSLNQTIKQITRQLNAVGTYTFYTESDPADPHEGDLWYKPIGDKTELYVYSKGKWVLMVNDLTGKQISDQVDQAQKDIKNALAVADAANTQAANNEKDLQLKIGTDEFNSSISELTNDINLRVKTGDLISQINTEAGQVLIQSGKILLDSPTVTFADKAFIPDAVIKNISATKITAGLMDASQFVVENLSGYGITSHTISADKLTVDAIQVGLNDMGDVIKINPKTLGFYSDGNLSLELNESGQHIFSAGTSVGYINGSHWDSHPEVNGLTFDLDPTGDYMAWGYKTNSTDKDYMTQLQWISKGVASKIGQEAGFSFSDVVRFNGGILPHGGSIPLSFYNYTVDGSNTGVLLGANTSSGIDYTGNTVYLIYGGTAYDLGQVVNQVITINGQISDIISAINSLGSSSNE